ncbi:phosphatidylinositol N-acetylglucosaminyltransferase subunit H isoform X1 [Cebus imitator]|uniref:Phosphatidylinositol N-acetylglucosaminyltransferase subunit H isoform X1 n=1 Tax=Sapajus apella TaxID=9515 RepID=A0A6J3F826_SAPAP|nr:phosphatidylinositol N-acetylglucosaminyltransferase subunit H isoform X1 [Cebus imitator]XP_032101725.1 phosphatidylinositol N-acetylglucosaminyltransferase subunit H isoform X1 [Sapajus apella]
MMDILLMEVFPRPIHVLSGSVSLYTFIAPQNPNKSNFLFLHACSPHPTTEERPFSSLPEVDLYSTGICRGPLGNLTACIWLSLQNSMILSAAIFITLVGLLGYLHFVKIDQETLLIIDSLGIQMTSSYASGKESTTFIEMGKVKDIVINEAIYMQKVIYYLCILLKDPVEPHGISQVVPVFQSAKPRLDCLIEVYRSCQEILAQQKATSTNP